MIKNYYYSFFLLFSITSIFAQEYSDEFLDSLPIDLRNSLINEAQQKKDLEATQYRRPSSFIKKPDVNNARFGSSYFSMMQSTLMPVNEPNFDPSYILDFGDVIQLQLTGQKNQIIEIPILRDGSISLPEIGKLFLSGLNLDDASKIIKSKFENSFIGVEAYITLINVRDIQVLVTGDAYNPGPYTLNGNSNIFHALSVSGGPSELGSFRSIDLIRDGKKIHNIDLYSTFLYGESDFGTRLRSGDVVFINPAKELVSINGAVKRPSQYELKDDESLEDLIRFSNGFTPSANSNEIIQEKINSEGRVIQLKILEKDYKNVSLDDGDSFFIQSFPLRIVKVSGAVLNPGTYRLNEGDGISELIKKAGGYNTNAYPFGGVLINESAKETEAFAKEKLFEDLLLSSIESSSSNESDSTKNRLLLISELQEMSTPGRVIAEFDLQKLIENPELDKKLMSGDVVIIPEVLDHIYIFGEVSNQGTVRFKEDSSIEDYIDYQGGLTSLADKNSLFILHPNGLSERISTRNIFQDRNNVSIYPGSIIFIPRKIPNKYRSELLQSYTSILSNLGVSLASISVLKD